MKILDPTFHIIILLKGYKFKIVLLIRVHDQKSLETTALSYHLCSRFPLSQNFPQELQVRKAMTRFGGGYFDWRQFHKDV